MARGKHGTKTINRERVIEDRTAPLRREVARLEALVARLDRQNLDQQAVHTQALAQARKMITSNTSERLLEEQAAHSQTKALLETTETARRVLADAFLRLADALQDAFEAQGMKPADAHERKMGIAKIFPSHINDTTPGFVICDDLHATVGVTRSFSKPMTSGTDPDEVVRLHRLQRAKGMRA